MGWMDDKKAISKLTSADLAELEFRKIVSPNARYAVEATSMRLIADIANGVKTDLPAFLANLSHVQN
jgi:hypothetical protein